MSLLGWVVGAVHLDEWGRCRRDGREILMYYNTLEFLCRRSKANSNNSRF